LETPQTISFGYYARGGTR